MDPVLYQRLVVLAESAVNEEIAALPAGLRAAISKCPVFYTTTEIWTPPKYEAEDYDKDMLGLFTGASILDSTPAGPQNAPQVTLFMDLLWWWTNEDEKAFQVQTAVTCLQELSCYLGWDRDTAAAGPFLGDSPVPHLYGPIFAWSSLPGRRFGRSTSPDE